MRSFVHSRLRLSADCAKPKNPLPRDINAALPTHPNSLARVHLQAPFAVGNYVAKNEFFDCFAEDREILRSASPARGL
jgi:hypothetical protein